MMFEQIDNMYTSATQTGALIFVITTCVLIVYLLFNLTKFLEYLMNKDTQENVTVNNKEIHIQIKNNTYEFNFNKIKKLFWWSILAAYAIGVLVSYSILVVPVLVLLGILFVRKVLSVGPFKVIKSVLRLESSK